MTWRHSKTKAFIMLAVLMIGAFLRVSPAFAQAVFINEFMASNGNTLTDVDGDYSDWIELFNSSAAPVNLDGWYLTDDSTFTRLWRFPAVTLKANGFLVVFASGKNRTNAAAQLHTSFGLKADGDYLALL